MITDAEKRPIKEGDRVSVFGWGYNIPRWMAGRKGTIVRLNRTRADVRLDGVLWNQPVRGDMLRLLSEDEVIGMWKGPHHKIRRRGLNAE